MNQTFAAFLAPLLFLLALPSSVAARQSGQLVLGAGGGGSYYCIITRCDAGTILRLAAGYAPAAAVRIDAGIRGHACFDCGRFRIFEAGVRLRYPASAAQPFVAAGIHRSDDPEFMGARTGPYAAIGVSFGDWGGFGLELEVLGRDFRRGDRMGEATVGVFHHFRP